MPITAETLAVLRQVAQNVIADDLKTEVTILHRARSSENAYGTSAETFTPTNTYVGWLVGIKASDLDARGGLAIATQEFELRLPVTAIVETGDQVEIGGAIYTVQNTNNEDTLPVFMEATLRRVE